METQACRGEMVLSALWLAEERWSRHVASNKENKYYY